MEHLGTRLPKPAAPGGSVGAGPGVLETLIDAEYERLFAYAVGLTRDRELAADVVQEAFVDLMARWVRVRNPRAYVFQVVTNLARKEWRRRAREETLGLDEGTPGDWAEAVAVRHAVGRLPRCQRDVVWLYYFAEMSCDEIAQVTGRPGGTVKWLLYDARHRLAGVLEGCRG